MKITKWIFVLTFVTTYSYAESVDNKIKSICGTHPVLSYLKEYKGALMDPQILTQAEECAKGKVKADVWIWKLADIDVQGCLQKKYGHEESYIKSIAAQFEEAKVIVGGQIAPYNSCANNVRNCGKSSCLGVPPTPKPKKPPYAIFNAWGSPVLSYGTFSKDSDCLDKLFSAQKQLDSKNAAKCARLSKQMWCISTKDLGIKGVSKDCHQTQKECMGTLKLHEWEVEAGGQRVMTFCELVPWNEL